MVHWSASLGYLVSSRAAKDAVFKKNKYIKRREGGKRERGRQGKKKTDRIEEGKGREREGIMDPQTDKLIGYTG